MSRKILVATDGTPAATGALRLAHSMAIHAGAEVEVMGVAAPIPVFDAGFLVAIPEGDLYASRRKTLEMAIREQVEEICGPAGGWPVRLEAGVPAQLIVRRAEALSADFIFMGLGEHKALDRIFGTETALQVIRLSHIPVLAVPESAATLPHSAVLGVDFSHFSRKAISSVAALLAPPWELHLAHVMAGMEFLPNTPGSWMEDYQEELHERLQTLAEGITVPEGSAVQLHVLDGDPSHEILSFMESREVELLAAGSHGHSFMGRLLIGSVSTRLVRGARTPVLVVPPDDRTHTVFPEVAEGEGEGGWIRDLKAFSEANAGRKTTMVIADAGSGERECGKGLPLLGACYDPRKDRVEIMLGRTGTVEGHLTHSIPGPRDITVERDPQGRAEALRIRLEEEDVVLRIHRD